MPEILIHQIAFGADGGPANLANGIELPIDNETLDRTMMCMKVKYPYIAHSYTFRLNELNGQITGAQPLDKLNSLAKQLSGLSEYERVKLEGAVLLTNCNDIDYCVKLMHNLDSFDLTPNISDYEALGRYFAANDFAESLKAVPPDMMEHFDYDLLGRMGWDDHTNVFVKGHHVWDAQPQNNAAAQSGTQGDTASQVETQNDAVSEDGTVEEYYTFELSDNVTRTHVSYRNRFGITLAGDLYMAKDLDTNAQHPALVIGPPFGGVKEQGPGVYANQLAQRGFVVLAFDPSYNGESGGEPRHVSSPDVFAEDFSAGVDYLGTQPFVDREKIGAIGICGSGGFALSAAQADTRIKAVAASAMYDISGMGSNLTGEPRQQMLNGIGEQRWKDFENGEPEYTPSFPAESDDAVPEELEGNAAEFYAYYGVARGHHPNALGGTTSTSMQSWLNFQLLNHIDQISPRPILFVTGDIAHSRAFSETAYEAAAEPKELYVVPDAMHIDLYDDVEKIPFDKLETFFIEAFQ